MVELALVTTIFVVWCVQRLFAASASPGRDLLAAIALWLSLGAAVLGAALALDGHVWTGVALLVGSAVVASVPEQLS